MDLKRVSSAVLGLPMVIIVLLLNSIPGLAMGKYY